ncbi:MAG: exopolysaccharide biosynthesis protein [Chthoniobacterales bacterium]
MSQAPASELAIPIAQGGRLSADIARVLDAFEHRAVTLGEIIQLMHQRAYSFLLLLIALPFCTPVPLPGLSTPFGLVIAFIGLRIACGLKPWLPDRMLNIRLPAKWLPKMFRVVQKPVGWLEKFLRPNRQWLAESPLPRRLHGLMILVCGSLLLLPLPIPFTNMIPAISVALLACAMLESDGRFSIAGAVVFAMALLYFGLLVLGGAAITAQINDWWRGEFGPLPFNPE